MYLLCLFDPQPLHSKDVELAPATRDFNGTSVSQVLSPLRLFGELAVAYLFGMMGHQRNSSNTSVPPLSRLRTDPLLPRRAHATLPRNRGWG